MKYDLWAFILIGMATWRIANMLSDTDQSGPWQILDKFRKRVGLQYNQYSEPYAKPGSLADMITCVYCNSIWIAIGFYILWNVNQTLTIIVSTPLALSAVAIFLQEFINGRSKMG